MLTFKKQRFVQEYLKNGGNATDAAKRAGYSVRTAKSQGQRLLTDADIKKLVQHTLQKAEVEAKAVLGELQHIGFADPRGYFDEDGNIKPLHELTRAQAAAIAGFEIIKKNAIAGDGHIDTVLKLKFWNKNHALETLMAHLGLLKPDAADDERPKVPVFIMPAGSRIATKWVKPTP